jgi:hypothetical protein
MPVRPVSAAIVWTGLLAWGATSPAWGSTEPERRLDSRPSSSPTAFPADLTVWPNEACYRASEPWLVENHDKLRKMRPRVMVLNFANDVEMDRIQAHAEELIRALAESSRHHGFKNPDTPAFLEYELVRCVDMRDRPAPAERAKGNSAFFPSNPDGPKDFACDYSAFYSDAFARFYGYADPDNPRRFRDLHELIEDGTLHELWFYAIHEYEVGWPAFEVIEIKQCYDEAFRPIPGKHVPAGNGHNDSMPWSGRTFRMAFFNPHRGVGCAMENFGHASPGISTSSPR